MASGGIAKPNSNVERESTENLRALLKAPYQAGRFKFNVQFMFDTWSKKLVRVNLVLLDPSLGPELENDLKSKYGAPIVEYRSATRWRDEENNNNIERNHPIMPLRVKTHSHAMSAYGYKQTFGEVPQNVRFTPVSGHWRCDFASVVFGCPLTPR